MRQGNLHFNSYLGYAKQSRIMDPCVEKNNSIPTGHGGIIVFR
jgi:hypothetical protein